MKREGLSESPSAWEAAAITVIADAWFLDSSRLAKGLSRYSNSDCLRPMLSAADVTGWRSVG